MASLLRSTGVGAILVTTFLVVSHEKATAQVLEQTFSGAVDTDYNTDGNWVGDSGMFVPNVDLALEIAAIGSNTPDPVSNDTFPVAIAEITDNSPDVGRLIIGFGSGTTGTLNVTGTGAINVKSSTLGDFSVNGEFVVGGGTAGSVLNMSSSGTITADLVTVSAGNSANLQGSASITSRGQAQLFGTTTVTGPNVTFDVDGNLVLGGTLVAEITDAANHSTLDATGNTATLGGSLNVDFGAISAPATGDSWEIVRAEFVTGYFASVNVVGSTALTAGQALNSRVVDGGSVRSVEVFVEQLLTLQVDRGNGNLTIVNTGPAGAGNDVPIDGYTITSPSESLNVGWNSLDDQDSFGDWRESNPSTERLSELKETASTTVVASGSSLLLENGWLPPAEFGVGGDLAFEYTRPDGTVSSGLVEYTGPANTLVLQIDPVTGEARMINQSQFAVEIDGYSVTSGDDALLTAWNSLDDQNAGGGDWRESNPSASRLSELKEAGALMLSDNTQFDLGTLYNTVIGSGDGDVVFEFLINDGLGGESISSFGEVVFAAIPEGLPGDFNDDGIVNTADYTVWRDNLGGSFDLNGNGDESGGSAGVVDAADYALWKQNFGTSSAASLHTSTSAVPTPSSGVAAVALAGAFFAIKRKTAS